MLGRNLRDINSTLLSKTAAQIRRNKKKSQRPIEEAGVVEEAPVGE